MLWKHQFRTISSANHDGDLPLCAVSKARGKYIRVVKKDSFRWIHGREFVARYEPEQPFKYVRCFCKKCGTALGEIDSEQDSFPVAVNCLDDDPVVRNRFHEFVSSKPAWYEICDGAKQFAEHPVKS